MEWETLPNWIFIIFYGVLGITLIGGVIAVLKRHKTMWSWLAVLFSVTIPLVAIIFSVGRGMGTNEFEFFIDQLAEGKVWSYYIIMSFVYLIGWWIFIFLPEPNTQRQNVSNGRSHR